MKKNCSLSAILTISFLSFFVTIFLITGIIGLVLACQAQKKIIFSNQQLITKDAAHTIQEYIQGKFIAMKTTANLVNPAGIPVTEQERIFNHLFGSEPAFRQLILLDSKKQKTTCISRLSQKGSESLAGLLGDNWFVQGRQGKDYISRVYVDKITSEPMVIMAVPVKDVFGDFQGMLLAEVNLKFMWDLVKSIKIGKSGLAYVVDRDGKLLASGDISRVLQAENAAHLKVVGDFIHNPLATDAAGANEFTGINGVTVLGSYVSLKVPDWAVVAELPLAEAYQPLIQIIAGGVIVVLMMTLLLGWISIRLARSLSVPLVNLMKTATRIAHGEIELQAEVAGPGEISNLATAFNSMTAQLREVIGNLDERRRYLEAAVRKYVEYMAEIKSGNFNAPLELETPAQGDTPDNQLVMLGWQLKDTISTLEKMIQQIKEANEKIKADEEKLFVYADKLQKSNNELEQFAFVVSHDLQEPLRKIQFFGNKLKTNYCGLLDEKANEYIDRMINSTVRMGKFIQDLLQYSRVTTKLKPYEKVDLNEIIREVLSDLEIKIEESGAEIITAHLPAIDADPLQMKQLFQNIIGNALKYRRENVPPVITVRAGSSDINGRAFYNIEIEDNGIGFDNQYAERVFGLFQRLHGRSEYEGTGIGLSVCKKIVEQHGGTIRAAGKVGEGASFHITLPVKYEKTSTG